MADASRARMQQIASECLVKSAHVILTSRIYHSSRTLSMKGPKCWVRAERHSLSSVPCCNIDHAVPLQTALQREHVSFGGEMPGASYVPSQVPSIPVQVNLDVEELDIAQRELDYWRRDVSCPMIIEVALALDQDDTTATDSHCRCVENCLSVCDMQLKP